MQKPYIPIQVRNLCSGGAISVQPVLLRESFKLIIDMGNRSHTGGNVTWRIHLKSTPAKKLPIAFALREHFNVLTAVALRDMRTRFFDHGLGFLVVILWPLIHMVLLLVIYNFAGRQAPYGTTSLFSATGLIPTLNFMYISRFMSFSLILNRPMLNFPVVKIIDIMLARAFLEVTAGIMTTATIMLILWIMGEDPFPYDPVQAVLGYLATILLAIGVGTLVGVIVMFAQVFLTIYALFMVIIYVSSGTLFVLSALPVQIAYPLSWNPVIQCTEWIRSAYFETYSVEYLSKLYLVGFGLTSLCLGLVLERVFRRKMFEG